MAGHWVFKTEPSDYSWDDLVRDKRTSWTGVKNALAQKHLAAVRQGDEILIYHTGGERALRGVARAATDAYPDPAAPGGKLVTVDLVPVRPVAHQATLAEIKAEASLANLPLVRMGRLSVLPATPAEWKRLLQLAS
jgi:predicted RNA-binding protein with PUA-like domain